MTMTELLLADLEREAVRSRKSLEQVPSGKEEWKPHDKSMAFGYLTQMIATMPSWIAMMVGQDELDIAPKDGPSYRPAPMPTSADLVKGLDQSVAAARSALQKTNDEFLRTTWRMLAAGQVVWEAPRDEAIRDTLYHQAHHRGQLTVYLRLLGATIPALYGPSADDKSFG